MKTFASFNFISPCRQRIPERANIWTVGLRFVLFSSHMVWFQISHFSNLRTQCLHYFILLRFTVMLGNILPLTGLCVVWYFIVKTRGEVFYSEIRRVSGTNDDTFSNENCNETCSYFGATNYLGGCKCEGGKSDSLFLRSKRTCKNGLGFRGK